MYHCTEKELIPQLKPLKLENIEQLDVANNKLDQYSRDLDDFINEPFVTKKISAFSFNWRN